VPTTSASERRDEMGRKKPRQQSSGSGFAPWEGERTLADVEAEEAEEKAREEAGGGGDARCLCGSPEFLLEAYLHVVDGRPRPVPVDVESLTCPRCGREFEPVLLEDGGVVRGEFRGYSDVDDEDDDP
jgi:hypothetical protein